MCWVRSLRPPVTHPAAALVRPLDVPVTVTGNHSQGEWYEFTHSLGPEPQSLQPVKVYSQDYGTLWGVGKYATDFGQGTASSNLFGTGVDGDITINSDITFDPPRTPLGAGVSAGQTDIPLNDPTGFNLGDEILLYQVQGNGAGNYEFGRVVSISGSHLTLSQPVKYTYIQASSSKTMAMGIPQLP